MLVPLVIDVGSLLVPVTTVAFALSRRREGFLTRADRARILAAGTLGLSRRRRFELYLLSATTGTFIGVGILEELGTGAVLLAVARRVPHLSHGTGWSSARS